jgi:DNA-binding transcriptional MocR family regulator
MNQSIEAVLGAWSDGPGPLHRKLGEAIRRAIDQGMLAAGERLPAERELASRLAVSRSTVVTAFDALRADGLLESRQGSGTRVRQRSTRRAAPTAGITLSPVYRSLIDTHDEVISLACAIFPAHPAVAEAMVDVVTADGPKLLTQIGYAPAGLPELREAVATMLTRDGTPTEPDEVLATTGAQQAVNLATQLLVRPGDGMVVESPSFAGTLDVFRTRGARLTPVAVDDDGIDVRGVRAAVAATRPAALYLMPTFHNPTQSAAGASWRSWPPRRAWRSSRTTRSRTARSTRIARPPSPRSPVRTPPCSPRGRWARPRGAGCGWAGCGDRGRWSAAWPSSRR